MQTKLEQVPLDISLDNLPNPYRSRFIKLVLIIVGILSFFLFMNLKDYIKPFAVNFFVFLQTKYESSPYLTILAFSSLFLFVQAMMLPMTFLCLVVAFSLKAFWPSYFLCTLSSTASSAIIYFVGHGIADDWINKRFSNNEVVSAIVSEAKSSPMKISLLIRFLAIPAGLKDYVLVIGKVPFKEFVASSFVSNNIFSTASVLAGLGLEKIEEAFHKNTSWIEKSTPEKLLMLIFILLGLFTLMMVYFISLWAKRKIDEEKAKKDIGESSKSGPVEMAPQVLSI